MAVKLREEESGAVVYQVTDGPRPKSDIYCETPYCSADSRLFVFEQQNAEAAPNSTEFVICEFGSWQTRVAGGAVSLLSVVHNGCLYYRRLAGDGAVQELVRLDLSAGREEVIFEFPADLKFLSLGSVSPDGRYYCYGTVISYDPQMFGIELADLEKGTRQLINQDPFICNPHAQFEPSEGAVVMVQHNRGCEFLPDGTMVKLVGDEGASEYLLDIHSGEVTPLLLGPPHTTPSTGHEAWIGDTREILVTVHAQGDFAPEKGNLLGLHAGAPHRVVAAGHAFSHVGTTPCGRFFTVDDGRGGDVFVGSPRTGKVALLCHSESNVTNEQNTHAHPYLSPDLKWVVFNSNRTSVPQVHAATVPPALLDGLENG